MSKLLLAPLLLLSIAAAEPSTDEAAIRSTEAVWHGAATADNLEPLLAEDFVRPMPNGLIWTKEQQIAWLRDRPPAPGLSGKPQRLDVRIYGDTAVATGVAVVLDPAGRELDATIFTNVYVKRAGNWQMVSAHRSSVTRPPTR
ncbi:MAG TPA: nuclear transport factor 2 family protein [Sphingomicrobium sp.]